MAEIKNVVTGHIYSVSEEPNLVEGIWECGNLRFIDSTGDLYIPVVPSPVGNLQPTPPQFMLLLTLMERVGIRAARATNVVVDDLLRMLEDPRLPVVDLVDPGIIEALNYMTTATPQLLAPARVARILTGQGVQA